MSSKNIKSTANHAIPFEAAAPCILVIFGITGDLTKRLLFPALCNLANLKLLNENFRIIGVSRESYTADTFHKLLLSNIREFICDFTTKKIGIELAKKTDYIKGEFSDQNTYLALKNKLVELQNNGASQNVIFYFASPPMLMEAIVTHLSEAGLLEENNFFRRLMLEKPFGEDLPSAKKLNQLLYALVQEKQIFRIDHFLGKESIRNLLTLRFLNNIFEPQWNHEYVDNVQITAAEILGVNLRGAFYDNVGALRDMVVNHLFQMLSLTAMEPPASMSSKDIQIEKEKVLASIEKLTKHKIMSQVVRGQYGPGKIDCKQVEGYRNEINVSPTSNRETFVALKLMINNPRWKNVPFYLRTGKRMKVHQTEISIQFKCLKQLYGLEDCVIPNILKIYVQPNDGISLHLNIKKPGPFLRVTNTVMDFKYSDVFNIKPQTGYEDILYDCMVGSHLLFSSEKMVETEWSIIQPILDLWAVTPPTGFPNYAAGTWGPKEAEDLIQNDGRQWTI